jgi:hypothetical protein
MTQASMTPGPQKMANLQNQPTQHKPATVGQTTPGEQLYEACKATLAVIEPTEFMAFGALIAQVKAAVNRWDREGRK